MSTAPHSQWIADFTASHGRPPRILHFGNICNNAYHIAKMLNAAGADCDVLSVDYYYFMGAPEWDDADFSGDFGSQLYPDWSRVDLQGYERPRWFAQGRRDTVIAYLLARRAGHGARAQRLWRKMQRHQSYLARREASSLKGLYALCEKVADAARMAARYLFHSPALFLLKLRRRLGGLSPAQQRRMTELEGTDATVERVHRDAAELFPDLDFPLPGLADYASDAANYAPLFAKYDVVHAYTMDPIWPYLAGCDSYVAFENGTLRYLAEDTSDAGRLALLAYARACAVMVTNTDCYDQAQYITQNSGTPVLCSLHGLDIPRMVEKVDAAGRDSGFDGRLGVPREVPLFYCPARHTWDEGLGLFLKGEDKAVRAAARLAEEGYTFQLALAEWGSDVPRAKALVDSLPALAGHVQWQPPVEKAELHKIFLAADATLDQFYWPVYGAITFEVLCAASSLLISQAVDEERQREFFGEALPYAACGGEDDIYNAMKWVLDEPEAARTLAAQGRAWILTHHNVQNIVQRCDAAYRLCPTETSAG